MTALLRTLPGRRLSWRGHSTTRRALLLVALLFTLIIGILVVLAALGLKAIAGVRAYVGGEGHWSRAQKNASLSLAHYTLTAELAEYERFRSYLRVPLADREARLELEKPQPDFRRIGSAFVGGRNHPADVPDFIFVFEYFRRVDYMARAIAIWEQGDALIGELESLGEEIHAEIGKGPLSEAARHAYLHRIADLDDRLTSAEGEFTFILGDAARWLRRTLLLVVLGMGGALLAVAVLASRIGSRVLEREEEALAKSELYYRSLIENALDVTAVFSPDGVLLFVSPSVERVLGYRPEELLGSNVFDMVHGEDREGVAETSRRVLKDITRVERFEYRVRHRDGSWRIIAAMGKSLPRETGIRGLILNARDATARRRGEQALRESEERFKSLFENALLGLYRTTPDGTILMANPALCRMLGCDSFEELEVRNLEADGFEPSYSRAEFKRKVEEAGAVMGLESRWQRRDGSPAFVRESARAVRDASGKVLYYEGTVEDITERKLAQEELARVQQQLLQAQKMEAVGRLAGGVAHDFNNLLTVIQGYGEMLSGSLAGDEERREPVVEILKAADRAATLTRQLLAFSRRQMLELRLFDLGAAVGETEKMLRRLIGEDIEIHVVRPREPVLVKADPGQVEQVLVNLAVNARDAMPEGGRLSVDVSEIQLGAELAASPEPVPAGRYALLTVSDDGTGMDEETLAQVFEPFFTTKEKGKGTGLGLSTVFGIVKQSGGFVAVESAPGHGTTFRIFLPRAEAEPDSKQEALAATGGGSETVLLVEDERAVRELTCRFLAGLGYRVLPVASGTEALALLDRHKGPVHLLATDVVMPDMNGPKLAEAVKSRRSGIRVLFMSGYSSDLLSREGLQKNGVHFLQKPFTATALAKAVREALDGPPPSGGNLSARA